MGKEGRRKRSHQVDQYENCIPINHETAQIIAQQKKLLFSYDPQTGIMGTVKLNNRWLVNLGLSAGNDIAPRGCGGQTARTASRL
jgi:hypothetical protein